MEAFLFIIDALQKIVYAGGMIVIVINGITLALNLKEMQGTQISSAGLGVLGGLLICLCAKALDLIRIAG